jgi:hypothetical protein
VCERETACVCCVYVCVLRFSSNMDPLGEHVNEQNCTGKSCHVSLFSRVKGCMVDEDRNSKARLVLEVFSGWTSPLVRVSASTIKQTLIDGAHPNPFQPSGAWRMRH